MNPLIVIAGAWLLALLIGLVSWEKGGGRVRKTDVVVMIVSVITGGAWIFFSLPAAAEAKAAATAKQRTATGTCAMIDAGDSEGDVTRRLGEPDEVRSEEELRGPQSKVWIYRDSRCAVHFFGSVVESIE